MFYAKIHVSSENMQYKINHYIISPAKFAVSGIKYCYIYKRYVKQAGKKTKEKFIFNSSWNIPKPMDEAI